MGVQGTFEYFSDIIKSVRKKKRKQFTTVNLKVTRIDCDGCARKLKSILSGLKGVKTVDVDMKSQKVTVTGFMDPKKVIEAAKTTKKTVELWPYVPYTMVNHPYIAGAYDKKAPPNLVRKVDDPMTAIEEQYTTMFSDDNPAGCSIM
ncbi:hypothetical protein KSS87_003604 [Heliosperma pusillum]|nr:hypothetical protein KSS87_003604 [Heliosperma pusillum]